MLTYLMLLKIFTLFIYYLFTLQQYFIYLLFIIYSKTKRNQGNITCPAATFLYSMSVFIHSTEDVHHHIIIHHTKKIKIKK